MSFMKFAATTAVAALISTTAWAGTISTLEYNGPAAGGYRTVTLDVVPPTLTVAGTPTAGTSTSVSAGGFDMNDTSIGGLGSSFIAWCLDLGAFLGTSGSHNYVKTSNPFQNGGVNLMEAGIARIQALFNANYGNPDVTTDRDTSAGFQLALWELVYDDDFNIGTGDFRASSASSDVEDAARGFLTAAETYGSGPNHWRLTFLESQGQGAARKQNLVTVSPVPLPASGIMLIAAVGGLVAARKRRKSA